VYPAQHRALAKEITAQGGLLTELPHHAKADKHNFPKRNRIVAGIADATIVVETQVKGGSMITAELANNYNRDVFAFPGKVTDIKSSGCNYLIKNNKAILLTDAQQLVHAMNWQAKTPKRKIQRELFIELTAEEKIIIDILKEKETIHVDELYFKSNISSSAMAAAILNLELQNIIISLPGKIYKRL
jgi:DNA processing protein